MQIQKENLFSTKSALQANGMFHGKFTPAFTDGQGYMKKSILIPRAGKIVVQCILIGFSIEKKTWKILFSKPFRLSLHNWARSCIAVMAREIHNQTENYCKLLRPNSSQLFLFHTSCSHEYLSDFIKRALIVMISHPRIMNMINFYFVSPFFRCNRFNRQQHLKWIFFFHFSSFRMNPLQGKRATTLAQKRANTYEN